jgi:hypothetical protein
MYKDYELTVEPGVVASDPTEFIKTFPPSTIERITITFPMGPNREVYTRILHESKPVVPNDPEEWINGENEQVVITGPWADWDDLYRLRIQLCSPGARLSHKIIYRFDLTEGSGSNAAGSLANRLVSKLLPLS